MFIWNRDLVLAMGGMWVYIKICNTTNSTKPFNQTRYDTHNMGKTYNVQVLDSLVNKCEFLIFSFINCVDAYNMILFYVKDKSELF